MSGHAAWLAARRPGSALHLDVAACGRVSVGCLDAQLSHLAAETEGGYVAEAAAEARLDPGRAALAAMVGLAATDVAFCGSASRAGRCRASSPSTSTCRCSSRPARR